jgi:hypothetical protein
MKRPTTDRDVAVYGMIRNSSLFLFIIISSSRRFFKF